MKMLVAALSLMLGLSLLSTINCRLTVHECISLKQAENIVVFRDDCWYFFIDDAPLLDWVHPCSMCLYTVTVVEYMR